MGNLCNPEIFRIDLSARQATRHCNLDTQDIASHSCKPTPPSSNCPWPANPCCRRCRVEASPHREIDARTRSEGARSLTFVPATARYMRRIGASQHPTRLARRPI